MNPVSEDIKDMLEADSGLGLTFATNLFVGREPEKPSDCVTIFDTYGMPPSLTLNPDERYEKPSIQVRVRNINYRIGWAMTQCIMDTLHGRAHETWNGTFYSIIYCSSGPAMLDWDDNGRVRFVINFNVQRRI